MKNINLSHVPHLVYFWAMFLSIWVNCAWNYHLVRSLPVDMFNFMNFFFLFLDKKFLDQVSSCKCDFVIHLLPPLIASFRPLTLGPIITSPSIPSSPSGSTKLSSPTHSVNPLSPPIAIISALHNFRILHRLIHQMISYQHSHPNDTLPTVISSSKNA